MEISIMMWIVLIIPAATVSFLFVVSKLSIYRNYIFLLIFLQAFLYLNLSPALLIKGVANEDMQAMYVWVQLFCVIFFEIPFVAIYLFSKSKVRNNSDHLTININNNRQIVFSVMILFVSILFVYIMTKYGLVFTRIGSEVKAIKFIELSSSPLWLISRQIEKSIFFLAGVLLFTQFANNKFRINRLLTPIALLFIMLTYGTYYLINSRLIFALFLFFIIGIIIYQSKWRFSKKWMPIILLFVLPVMLVYSMNVASNIRNNFYYDDGVSLRNFIPWYSVEDRSDESLIKRMDGIDLMAQVSLNMRYDEIPLGRAWLNPLFMIVGPFINKEKADELKLNTSTTAKSYLMENYTETKLPDYYSCMLTDAYGNFWIFGLIIVATFLGVLSAHIDVNLLRPTSSISLIISIYLMSIILPFEQEFISIFGNIFQTLPVLFLVIILNPIKAVYRDGGEHNVFG